MILNPATRNIQQVTIEDIGKTEQIIQDLMGADAKPKKDFVFGTAIKEII